MWAQFLSTPARISPIPLPYAVVTLTRPCVHVHAFTALADRTPWARRMWASTPAPDVQARREVPRARHRACCERRSVLEVRCASAASTREDSPSMNHTDSSRRLFRPLRPLELWLDTRAEEPDALKRLSEAVTDEADAVIVDGGREERNEMDLQIERILTVSTDEKLVDGCGRIVGGVVSIRGPEDQSRALSLIGSVDWIQVKCTDWTMIPAENLVSAAGGSPTMIAIELSNPSHVTGAAFALQSGVDALVLRPNNELWAAGLSAREERRITMKQTLEAEPDDTNSSRPDTREGDVSHIESLSVGEIIGTRDGGLGDRVCVDLIQSLHAGEGMLIGSSAKLLALVHAETFDTGFVPARPFRVNAGPVHAYTVLADGTTKYLSELRAGDQVHVVNHEGQGRPVAIGRLKIETRPMIMVDFKGRSGNKGQLFLQQAETVKLMSPNASGWRPLPVTDIVGGESLFLRERSRGTHVGRAIDVSVQEL